MLEERGFELLLVNARHVKILPGRKTDVGDAAWLCELLEHGLLRGSFVPPPVIRELRDLTRYRKLCRHRHSLRYAEARIMPMPGQAAKGAAVIGVQASA